MVYAEEKTQIQGEIMKGIIKTTLINHSVKKH